MLLLRNAEALAELVVHESGDCAACITQPARFTVKLSHDNHAVPALRKDVSLSRSITHEAIPLAHQFHNQLGTFHKAVRTHTVVKLACGYSSREGQGRSRVHKIISHS